MFGLSRREQRWKAEQKQIEALVPLLVAAIESIASVRIAEAQADAKKKEVPTPQQEQEKSDAN